MSGMEWNKGVLTPIVGDIDVYAQSVITEEEVQKRGYDDVLEMLLDSPEDYSVYCIDNKYYKVSFEVEGEEYYDPTRITVSEDGTISFLTYHYNGGGHWTEVIEHELEKNNE